LTTEASGAQRAQEEALVAGLQVRGWAVCDDFLSPDLVGKLADEAGRLRARGAFRAARVGRGPTLRADESVRTDQVSWIDWENASRSLRRYHERMEALRSAINRELQLGLFGFEAHFAIYEPGAFYRTHFDRFRNAEHRIVSAIVYLNREWREADGGALSLYVEGTESATSVAVQPVGGRLVIFDSGRFPHEVLPAGRQRAAITGWFTARPR